MPPPAQISLLFPRLPWRRKPSFRQASPRHRRGEGSGCPGPGGGAETDNECGMVHGLGHVERKWPERLRGEQDVCVTN